MANLEKHSCDICGIDVNAPVATSSCDYCDRTVCENCINIDVPDHLQKTCNRCMKGWDVYHNLPPSKNTQELIDHLQNKSAAERHNVVDLLKMHRNPDAKEAILKATRDSDEFVRSKCAEALKDFPSPHVRDRLIEMSRVDLNAFTRAQAAESLATIIDADDAFPLLESLNDPDEHVVGTACRLLGELKVVRALEPLEELARKNKGGFPSHAALQAIHNIDPLLGEILALKFLKQKDELHRFTAVVILSKSDSEDSLRALIPMLKDPFPNIRSEAAWAIRQLGKSAVKMLLPLLKDNNPTVRSSAYKHLLELDWKPGNKVDMAIAYTAEGDVNRLKIMGESALPAVEILMNCELRQSQIDALAVLAAVGTAKAKKLIKKMTKSKDSIVVAEAQRTMRSLEND